MNKHPGITPISRSGRSSYQVRYRNAEGVLKSKTFNRLSDAKNFKAQADAARRSGGVLPGSGDKVLFADLACDWIASTQHRPSTAKR